MSVTDRVKTKTLGGVKMKKLLIKDYVYYFEGQRIAGNLYVYMNGLLFITLDGMHYPIIQNVPQLNELV